MSDIDMIRKVEEEQSAQINEEQEKAKERINRAKADSAFRVNSTLRERREVIEGILEKSNKEARKEITFIREDNTEKNSRVIKEEAGRLDTAVEFVLKKIFS